MPSFTIISTYLYEYLYIDKTRVHSVISSVWLGEEQIVAMLHDTELFHQPALCSSFHINRTKQSH